MSEPANSVPAATILMLRNHADNGLEVFMVVRHHQIDFASGALVFPGGKIDQGDGEVGDLCDGVENADAPTRTLMAGAIREAFEECGILLARSAQHRTLVSGERLTSLEPYRDALNNSEISLLEFLQKENLVLACDLLQPFAHWITPEVMPKRFDTHFYLAAAPADHIAIHDGHESIDSIWISPGEALAGGANQKFTIIFPTRLNIELLGKSDSVENAFEMARERTIVAVLPRVEKREDGNYLRIPAEAGYGISEAKMEKGNSP